MATQAQKDSALLIRRILFFVFLISLTLLNLIGSFRGLNTERGMEQAQMGREIARGNFLGTKMIRPLAFAMAEGDEGKDVFFRDHKNTYHAPLHPMILGAILKIAGGDDFEAWKMGANEPVYGLDRVIAASSVIFFLLALGVNYLLVCRIFDTKIGGVTALLLLLCNLFWGFSATGLPQMLMLLWFSLALFFAYSAIEAQHESKPAALPALLAGIFLVLLTLTHWLAIWILAGYIIYCAVTVRPRGVLGLVIAVIALAASFYFINHNIKHTGSFLGSAYMTIYNNLSFGSEDIAMRTYGAENTPLDVKRLIFRILNSLLIQLTDIFKFLGAIIAAPVFFLSLLHAFKKASIAQFRWLVLTLWGFAAAGMAIYGVSSSQFDSNHLHLLFIPVMTAYGLAFLSIIWSKVEAAAHVPFLRNAHFIVVVLISAGPLILSLPRKISNSAGSGASGIAPNWPPYKPNVLNTTLSLAPEDGIIISDQPWATAWYADRMALWMPRSLEEFEALDKKATEQQNPISGFLVSPTSHTTISLNATIRSYGDLSALSLDGPLRFAAAPAKISFFDIDPDLAPLAQRFRFQTPLQGQYLMFYGERALK